jgi:hypothetical protein
MYDNGRGVVKDEQQAAGWWRQAATQGFADAEVSLGVCYAKGEGVPHDDAQAAVWYRHAAQQGVAAAQFYLGESYAKGEGVARDDVEALKWLTLAAARAGGDEQKAYSESRDTLAGQMTPARVAKAQKRSREWTEGFEWLEAFKKRPTK